MQRLARRSRFPLTRTATGLTAWFVLAAAQPPLAFAQDPNGDSSPSSTLSLADADDLVVEGSYDRATEAYRSLLKDRRSSFGAALGLARCQTQVGRYDEAIAGLVELARDDAPKWHYMLAGLYRRKGRYADVLTHAERAVALRGSHAAARRLLAETLELTGRRDQAIEAYRWFDRQLVDQVELPRDPQRLTNLALGFLRYSVLTQTNVVRRTEHALSEMLQTAYERLDRTYWPARIAAGDLLREKFNNDEEDGSVSDYMAALRINEKLPEAHVGIGEVMLNGWNFEEVERRAELALATNPNHAPALHLLAKKLILERRYAQAIETCERALAINPYDVTALSVSAAASACRYDDEAATRMAKRVSAINPRCALFHRTLGDALAGIRQYADSERAYRQAIDHDPTDANARTELGMMYMQWGYEQKARDALEASWALDPFNERTKFTLELLERLGEFARVETEHFIVKYDAQRDPGIGEIIAVYAEEMYASVTADYDTALGDKTIIEIFPTRRAFGVRITGKPWIHTIGASTGRVIALSSPRDTAHTGRYDLARVLKHEFTHTVTLEATKNRIPHWFTEGLAVYQEDAPRSFVWCELLADAVRRDRLFTLESIDWGFIRPKRQSDRQMAYAQSEWMCEYIVERFGYDAINAMIRRFRAGETQREVFTAQLGLAPEAFDRAFERFAKDAVARWGFDLAPPENVAGLRVLVAADETNAALIGRLAKAQFDAGDLKAALTAARRAITLDGDELNGLRMIAAVLALHAGQAKSDSAKRTIDEEALPALGRLMTLDPKGWLAPKYLADIALRRDELDRAVELLTRLQRLCPMDPASWRGLAGIHLQRGDLDLAFPQLLELARTDENDPEIPMQIARIARRAGRLREALYWYKSAVYLAPFDVGLHAERGDTAMQAGDTTVALQAYKLLTQLEPGTAKHFEKAAFAAHKMGATNEAQKLAAKAVKLDAASPARSLIP